MIYYEYTITIVNITIYKYETVFSRPGEKKHFGPVGEKKHFGSGRLWLASRPVAGSQKILQKRRSVFSRPGEKKHSVGEKKHFASGRLSGGWAPGRPPNRNSEIAFVRVQRTTFLDQNTSFSYGF